MEPNERLAQLKTMLLARNAATKAELESARQQKDEAKRRLEDAEKHLDETDRLRKIVDAVADHFPDNAEAMRASVQRFVEGGIPDAEVLLGELKKIDPWWGEKP